MKCKKNDAVHPDGVCSINRPPWSLPRPQAARGPSSSCEDSKASRSFSIEKFTRANASTARAPAQTPRPPVGKSRTQVGKGRDSGRSSVPHSSTPSTGAVPTSLNRANPCMANPFPRCRSVASCVMDGIGLIRARLPDEVRNRAKKQGSSPVPRLARPFPACSWGVR